MITWTNHRRQVKMHAKRSLLGSFLKGVFGALLSFTASLFALSFMPLNMPDTINTTNLKELLMSVIPQGDTKTILGLAVISTLLYLLLIAPFKIGKHRFYLKAITGEKPKFKIFFSSFTSLSEVFSSCVLVVITAFWQVLLAVLLFAIPVGLLYFSPILGPLAKISSLVLYIAAAILFVILLTPCKMAPFLLAEKPERGAFKSLILAYKRMRGIKREFLVFDLSFILWRLLFGLNAPGTFFIDPYITASMAGFFISMDACKK